MNAQNDPDNYPKIVKNDSKQSGHYRLYNSEISLGQNRENHSGTISENAWNEDEDDGLQQLLFSGAPDHSVNPRFGANSIIVCRFGDNVRWLGLTSFNVQKLELLDIEFPDQAKSKKNIRTTLYLNRFRFTQGRSFFCALRDPIGINIPYTKNAENRWCYLIFAGF